MAGKPRGYRSQSTYDFHSSSKVAHDQRERELKDQQTRRRPASAASLPSQYRQLPQKPWQVDSGAHSPCSSTGDLDLSPDGEYLVQSFRKAVTSGEKSAKELRKAEAERDALRNEIRELEELIKKQQQALDGISKRSVYMYKEYLNTPPNVLLKMLREVEALTKLDLNALSSTAENDDHRSRSGRDASMRTNSGKQRQQPRRSGTDADVESTSSSSSNESNSPEHQTHQMQDGFHSDNMQSCKEEGVVPHQGTGEIAPVYTDAD